MLTTLAFVCFATLAAPPRIALNDPRLVEVRAIVADVDTLVTTTAKRVENTHRCDAVEATTTLVLDTQGRPRRLRDSFGGQDSVTTIEATYDAGGTLRFLFITAGAVTNSTFEQRFWFDARGVLLTTSEQERGQGWTWWRPDDRSFTALRTPREFVARGGMCTLTK
jgi:hypothetical protein